MLVWGLANRVADHFPFGCEKVLLEVLAEMLRKTRKSHFGDAIVKLPHPETACGDASQY